MSGELVGWVFDHATVKGAELLVLLDLAERTRQPGAHVYPSAQTISLRTNLTERSVRGALASLKIAGWISEVGRMSNGTVKWQISTPELPRKLTRAERAQAVSPPEDCAPPEPISGGAQSSKPGADSSRPPCKICTQTVSEPSGRPAKASSARDAQLTRRDDQSQPPDEFPDSLARHLEPVLEVLRRIWRERGGPEPTTHNVALAMLRRTDVDHVHIAQKLERWLSAGKGKSKAVDDIVRRYESWVETEIMANTTADPQPEQCPGCDGDAPRQAFDRLIEGLRRIAKDDAFEAWLAEFHPHTIDDAGRLILGTNPGKLAWIEHRFARILDRASEEAGTTVRLVPCHPSELRAP